MSNQSLEVLGIGSLKAHCYLVYFSDQTYATVSSSQLAQLFPQRQSIPQSLVETPLAESSFLASLASPAADLRHSHAV